MKRCVPCARRVAAAPGTPARGGPPPADRSSTRHSPPHTPKRRHRTDAAPHLDRLLLLCHARRLGHCRQPLLHSVCREERAPERVVPRAGDRGRRKGLVGAPPQRHESAVAPHRLDDGVVRVLRALRNRSRCARARPWLRLQPGSASESACGAAGVVRALRADAGMCIARHSKSSSLEVVGGAMWVGAEVGSEVRSAL